MKTENICKFLSEISSSYQKTGDMIRSGTFQRAVTNITESGIEEVEDGSSVSSIYGIGPSIVSEINQFIKTGTSTRYEDLKSNVESLEEFDKESSDKLESFRTFMEDMRSNK